MEFAGAAFADPHEALATEPVIVINAPALSPEEEQEKWLAESLRAAQEAALEMRQAMQKGTYAGVLRAASRMLAELRTDVLIPQNYYELYLSICDELYELGLYLVQQHAEAGRSYEQMYEEVQYVGPILPRLYLLMLVGSLYMSSGQVPALAIARDLIEMCKGVQHPTRGLFLRHFFLLMTRGKLPGDDSNNSSSNNNNNSAKPEVREGEDDDASDNVRAAPHEGGTVLDTAALLLQNLREMYWLWLRMKIRGGHRRRHAQAAATAGGATPNPSVGHAAGGITTGIPETNNNNNNSTSAAGPLSSARRARRDRSELRVLVGMNIVRLSQLDGIDMVQYREKLLPRLLTILLRHNDTMAQQYLFEVIVQVFPDEYHLDTLDVLLEALLRLAAEGDVCGILRALTTRITKHVLSTRTEHPSSTNGDNGDGEDERATMKRKEEAEGEGKAKETHSNVLDAFLSKFEQVPVAYAIRHRTDRPAVSPSTNSSGNSSREAVRQPTLLLAAYVEILTCITTMAIEIDTDAARRRGHLNRILSAVAQRYEERRTQQQQQGQTTTSNTGEGPWVTDVSAAALSATLDLMTVALDHTDSLHALLEMESFRRLLALLPFAERHSVGLQVCAFALGLPTTTTTTVSTDGKESEDEVEEEKALRCNHLCSLAHAARFFELIDALLYERPGRHRYNEETSASEKALAEEQATVCRVLLYILPCITQNSKESAVVLRLKMVAGVRRLLLQGGTRRMRHTLPTLLTLYLQTIDAVAHMRANTTEAEVTGEANNSNDKNTAHADSSTSRESMLQQIFQHLYAADGSGVLEVMSLTDPVAAFHLSLTCASRADRCKMPEVCYDLYVHAFTLYQHYAALRQDETTMLTSLINALYLLQMMPEAQYDVLATKTCQYTTRLLHRQDQSRLLALAAVLFDKATLAADQRRRVHECLQRAVGLASYVAAPHKLGLYVDLLNICLRFFDQGSTSEDEESRREGVKEVQELLEHIQEHGGLVQQQQQQQQSNEPDTANNRREEQAVVEHENSNNNNNNNNNNQKAVAVRTMSVGVWCSDGSLDGRTSSNGGVDVVQRVYRDTLAYIRTRQQQEVKEEGGEGKARWRLIRLQE